MVKDLIVKNRSYRGYDESCVFTREQLMNYVDGARFCASSINIQPLKYFIAYDKEDVDKIQCRIKWARQLPQMTLPHPGMCPTGFVVICQDKNISDNLSRCWLSLLASLLRPLSSLMSAKMEIPPITGMKMMFITFPRGASKSC